jgi:hypothetical protein
MSAPALAFVYAIPVRALRRWVSENLTLTSQPDGTRRAVFRFEGSTCGNVPFNLLYTVALSPLAGGGWQIADLGCTPAPFDDNHRQMCALLNSPERLPSLMQEYQPLKGETLGSALDWQPATAPDGCLCAPASRAHKWRAVLHTIHYALYSTAPAS